MTQDNLVKFKTPETSETFKDALSELLRQGARQIIAGAVEAELNEFLGQYKGLRDAAGRQAVVRNGYLPARTITTGVGEIEVQVGPAGAFEQKPTVMKLAIAEIQYS